MNLNLIHYKLEKIKKFKAMVRSHLKSEYLPQRDAIAQLGGYVHWYGKTESREGIKLRHVKVLLEEKNPEKMY